MNNDMTEKFRKLLDDNGIEWMVGSTGSHEFDTTSFRIEDQWWAADTYEECIELMTVVAKPEKVIAATLGSESVDYMLNTIGKLEEENERLRSSCGTLTAEQVEKVIRDCSTYASYDGCTYYASGIRLQAIADELNAKLGSGTCEPKWTLQGETQTQEFWSCECGNCGEYFGTEDRESFPFKITIDKVDIPNYCPNCGRKVVSA